MTRILTLTSWYPPHHFGGYELSCFDVMTRLSRRGHEVRVLCGDERVPGARPADDRHEALVHRELRPHLREGDPRRPALRDRIAIERHNHRVLARHLEAFEPDVVSVWHMCAISVSLLRPLADARLPVVNVVCDNWPVYTRTTDPWVSLFEGGLLRAVAGRAVESVTRMPTSPGDFTDRGAFCFVSEFNRRQNVADRPWSYPVSTVVYSGIEPSAFARTPVPAALAPAPGWRILYVGRLDAWKGVDTLLRTMALLPAGAELRAFGLGAQSERARLGKLAASLGLEGRVTFGSLERSELAAAYSAADVVVFPSEWPEPFGLVPIEAMACGTPVVATGVGGSGEFLRDGGNCLLYPAGDATALAAAVRRVRTDDALRARLVRGGHGTAREFGVDRLAATLERWHVAAAGRFADGLPTDRRDPDRVLEVTAATDSGPVLRLGVERDPSPASAPGLVVARASALPFRAGTFGTVIGDARLAERNEADAEIARVLRSDGRAVFVAPNRADALLALPRLRDRIRAGHHRPPQPFAAVAVARSVSWNRLEAALRGRFEITARHGAGWAGGRKRQVATSLARLRAFRRLGAAIVLEARPIRAALPIRAADRSDLDRDAARVVDAMQ